MLISGDVIKVELFDEELVMATVLHKQSDDSYFVIVADTGEILEVKESSITAV
jgi:hypothetical protein